MQAPAEMTGALKSDDRYDAYSGNRLDKNRRMMFWKNI